MIFHEHAHLPDFPFERYFESINQYIAAQQYWLRVLRIAEGFHDADWKPVIKAVDVKDDMYTGLLIEIENEKARKYIKIYATSMDGWANFVLNEDLETAELMGNRDALDPAMQEIYGSHDALVAQGHVKAPVTTLQQAQEESRDKFSKTGGFEAGVGQRDFYVEEQEDTPEGPFAYGEELSILSTVSVENETKALQSLELFLQPGAAMDRVNRVFAPDEE